MIDHSPKTSDETEAILTHIVRAEDMNMHGSLFGGKMMAFMDTCAAIAAMRHGGRNCVTARIGHVSFTAPVRMGHILELRSRVVFTARSSMDIHVSAMREDHVTGDRKEVCSAYFTFVAIDGDQQPVTIPPVDLVTDDDRHHNAICQQRYEARKAGKIAK